MAKGMIVTLTRKTLVAPTPGATGKPPPDGARAVFGIPGDRLEIMDGVKNGPNVWCSVIMRGKDGAEKARGFVIDMALIGQPGYKRGKVRTNG